MATSPSTEARGIVKQALEAEFGAELRIRNGRLHPAIQGPMAGVWPVQEGEGARVLDQTTLIGVQVYLRWEQSVDPNRVVDPAPIEAVAERLREALYDATHPFAGSSGVWDLRVLRVEYEDDPTGGRTRFTAYVQAIGQNFAETTG